MITKSWFKLAPCGRASVQISGGFPERAVLAMGNQLNVIPSQFVCSGQMCRSCFSSVCDWLGLVLFMRLFALIDFVTPAGSLNGVAFI